MRNVCRMKSLQTHRYYLIGHGIFSNIYILDRKTVYKAIIDDQSDFVTAIFIREAIKQNKSRSNYNT